MKKSTVSSPQPIPFRYSDLETDIAPPPAPLPFLPKTDPAILERAVKKGLALLAAMEQEKREKNNG